MTEQDEAARDEREGRPGPGGLTHLRQDGAVHMVEVGAKTATRRTARAQAVVTTRPDVVRLLAAGELAKGEAIAVARVAGIMAAKQTAALVPLCHPLPITGVDVQVTAEADRVRIETTVSTTGVTGVEMEALTAASVAALTVYDMIKGVDRAAVIGEVMVLEKHGGRSGDWERP